MAKKIENVGGHHYVVPTGEPKVEKGKKQIKPFQVTVPPKHAVELPDEIADKMLKNFPKDFRVVGHVAPAAVVDTSGEKAKEEKPKKVG